MNHGSGFRRSELRSIEDHPVYSFLPAVLAVSENLRLSQSMTLAANRGHQLFSVAVGQGRSASPFLCAEQPIETEQEKEQPADHFRVTHDQTARFRCEAIE
jgi:hypothetical protein